MRHAGFLLWHRCDQWDAKLLFFYSLFLGGGGGFWEKMKHSYFIETHRCILRSQTYNWLKEITVLLEKHVFVYLPAYLQLRYHVQLTVPWQVEQHAALGFCWDVNWKSVPTSKKQQGNRFAPRSAHLDIQHWCLWPQRAYFIRAVQNLLQCLGVARRDFRYSVFRRSSEMQRCRCKWDVIIRYTARNKLTTI